MPVHDLSVQPVSRQLTLTSEDTPELLQLLQLAGQHYSPCDSSLMLQSIAVSELVSCLPGILSEVVFIFTLKTS